MNQNRRWFLGTAAKRVSKFVVLLFLFLALGASVVHADTSWAPSPSNPVLSPTPHPGTVPPLPWDWGSVLFPRILYNGTGYQMWYSGSSGVSSFVTYEIGYATSADGVQWAKSTINPVLSSGPTGSWDSESVSAPAILYNGTAYIMWYVGAKNMESATFDWWRYMGTQSFGLATSTNGVTWKKYSGNPVMTQGGADSYLMYNPWVLQIGSQFKMWYTCQPKSLAQMRICYATSIDGIHWTKNSSPVLTGTGAASDWDSTGVYSPSVLYDGHTYGMWYAGYQDIGSSEYDRIGYATSSDGVTWMRSPVNPLLSGRGGNHWDSYGVGDPSVMEVSSGVFRTYYDGYRSSDQAVPIGIGFAESPANFTLPELPSPTIFTIVVMTLMSGTITLERRRRISGCLIQALLRSQE